MRAERRGIADTVATIPKMPQTIVVAHDLSELADRALAWAAQLAQVRGDSITLLHVAVLMPNIEINQLVK